MINTNPPRERTVEVKIKYRIYYVDTKGMLNTPKTRGYGHNEDKYGYFDSMEIAAQTIAQEKDYCEYVILPVTFTSIK